MTWVIENFAAQSYSDLSGGSMNGMVLCSLVQRQVAGSQALIRTMQIQGNSLSLGKISWLLHGPLNSGT